MPGGPRGSHTDLTDLMQLPAQRPIRLDTESFALDDVAMCCAGRGFGRAVLDP